MDEITKEFIIESNETLERMDRTLVDLEQTPADKELLATVFRAIHTVKGTSGCLGFSRIEVVAHAGENILSRLRDGQMALTAEIISALLATTDILRRMLASIEQTEAEGDTDTAPVLERLHGILEPCAKQSTAVLRVVASDELPQPALLLGEILVERGQAAPDAVSNAIRLQTAGDPRRLGRILVEDAEVPTIDVADALLTQVERRSQISNSAIRVDVNLLDKVMNLVGELVLARNQVLQFTTTNSDTAFLRTAQRLNLITTELQEGVMKTRMQPIGNVWNTFPRVVRDLSLACNKQVRLDMEGAETELDKTIIEAIKDPLTHIVRNAIDHGIESAGIRIEHGKPPEGVVHLQAFHEGGQVNIVVRDDGAGIDCDRVKQKALEKGLLTQQQLTGMPDHQVCRLLFLPGLSTAAKVTNISGRGVGLDVVKTNVEKIGGTVDIQSTFGAGTTIKIKIPLTLAIIPALLVLSGGESFAIPQVSLVELVRLEGNAAVSGIEWVHGAAVHRLRGTLLPLVSLNDALRLDPASTSAEDVPVVNIVVIQAEGRQFGLIVDHIHDTEEIVVKPLGKQLKKLRCFAGATILGDGRVALILDVPGLAQLAKLSREEPLPGTMGDNDENVSSAATESWLLFRVGEHNRLAIPLSAVSRLEEFDVASIETSNHRSVIQYRGAIMQLTFVADLLHLTSVRPDKNRMQVVVYSEHGRNVGLVVDEIIDIVDQHIEISDTPPGENLLGTAVLQNRVTDLLNVCATLAACPHLADAAIEKEVYVY